LIIQVFLEELKIVAIGMNNKELFMKEMLRSYVLKDPHYCGLKEVWGAAASPGVEFRRG
jgi:hypothetical protein